MNDRPSEMPQPPLPAGSVPAKRRPRPVVLFTFLGVFLLLLIVFRAVLFPFLMAMFVAYLIEPVVGWISRGKRLGMKWRRGPIVIGLYVLVLGSLGYLILIGVNRLDATIQGTAAALRAELAHTSEKARIVLLDDEGKPANAPGEIGIPRGTRLVYDPPPGRPKLDPKTDKPDAKGGRANEDPAPGVYRTRHYAEIREDEAEIELLLDRTDESIPAGMEVNRLLDPTSVSLARGLHLGVEPRPFATGLEVFSERHVIGPIAAAIEEKTGAPFDPGLLRRAIAVESEKQGAKIGEHVGEWARTLFGTLFVSLTQLVLVLMLTAFIVVDRARISAFFASLPPPHLRSQYDTLISYVDRGLAGVIRGQLLICVVNGILTWIGLWILGIRYAGPLALLAGVFSLIPVFGTIASSIPIVLVSVATGGVMGGVYALAWITLIHLLEANIFNPLIMGTSAEMHPVVIVFALLAGEHAFGVWGALLAVPTASIIQACFKYYRHEVEGVPVEEHSGHGAWLQRILGRKRRPGGTA
jgi:predicted PurR-regulated permease PerM